MSSKHVDSLVQFLYAAHEAYPIVGILIIMMGLDIATGIGAAVITKTLSSTVSFNGMIRKAMMLTLIAVGAVLDPFAGGIPVSKLMSMCFLFTELISIIENAKRSGIPIPRVLVDILIKERGPSEDAVTVVVTHTDKIDITPPHDGHGVYVEDKMKDGRP